jgi:PIN domain nuclease of toxin-antitoxin system
MQAVLLDTCAVIWLAEGEPLAKPATEALGAAVARGLDTLVSPITAWEVGLLVSRGRLQMLTTPQRWFARVLGFPGMQLAEMSPELLIAASFLPGKPPRDPADRIIAATARDLGATLITRDRVLLDYGAQGHLSVVAC